MASRLDDIGPSTLGELIEVTVEKELVEFCYVSSKVVVISIGRHQLSYAPEEARLFLRSLVQGWSRSRSSFGQEGSSFQSEHAPLFPLGGASADRPPQEKGAEPQRGSEPPEASRTAPPAQSAPREAAPQQKPPRSITSSEDYMDAVLAFAEEMQLIQGFDKNRKAGRVTLHTQATTTEMSYFETLEYLTNSILHELRSTAPQAAKTE